MYMAERFAGPSDAMLCPVWSRCVVGDSCLPLYAVCGILYAVCCRYAVCCGRLPGCAGRRATLIPQSIEAFEAKTAGRGARQRCTNRGAEWRRKKGLRRSDAAARRQESLGNGEERRGAPVPDGDGGKTGRDVTCQWRGDDARCVVAAAAPERNPWKKFFSSSLAKAKHRLARRGNCGGSSFPHRLLPFPSSVLRSVLALPPLQLFYAPSTILPFARQVPASAHTWIEVR
ncbi:hypothetical protein K456DRAFT_1120794 [Colletotrichum gloeosporioides 23]|nr:hypothetical protein K456DRAFT_1120794 [Colletotrichum gloeosporioides 23]